MKKFLSAIFALFLFTSVYAQSSDVITDILDASEVTFGQVCYLSAVFQGFVEEDASFEQAIRVLYNKKQIPNIAYEESAVAMVNLAFLYAQMWDIKGGIFYRLTNGSPRYAFKQMKADGVIAADVNPTKIVSGKEALNLFTSCSLEYGKVKLSVD